MPSNVLVDLDYKNSDLRHAIMNIWTAAFALSGAFFAKQPGRFLSSFSDENRVFFSRRYAWGFLNVSSSQFSSILPTYPHDKIGTALIAPVNRIKNPRTIRQL